MPQRPIIVHFHFFKNAGTSIETILRKNFKKRFMIYEPGGPADTFPASVLKTVLEEHPKVQAISSHTIRFPLPADPGWSVYPLVLIRHPLDRIQSMYTFEKTQRVQSPGATLAREHGLPGYIEARLENSGERTMRNYQAWMLAGQADRAALPQAAAESLSKLPVVGVVDRFNQSIERFSEWLKPVFPRLKMRPVHRQKSSPGRMPMDERIRLLRKQIGDELLTRVEQENAVDLELYRRACNRLDAGNG